MQRIEGNKVKEAAAAGKERILHSVHLKKSEFPASYQRRTPCRGIFPTWRFGWKAGTPVSLSFVFHSNPVIHANVSALTTTFLNCQHKKIRYLILKNLEYDFESSQWQNYFLLLI